MGFGLLFVGLTLVLSMTAYGVLPSFVGYFLCMYACFKLSSYEKHFRFSAWAMGVVGTLSLMYTLLQLVILKSGNTRLSDFANNLQLANELVFYFGQFALLPALSAIAKETGRRRTELACKRNMGLYAVMYGFFIAANILLQNDWEYGRICLVYVTVSRLLVAVLTMVQVFSCYMWICREGEENEETELPGFFNRRVDRFGKREEEKKEAEEESKWLRNKRRKKK